MRDRDVSRLNLTLAMMLIHVGPVMVVTGMLADLASAAFPRSPETQVHGTVRAVP